MTVIIEPRLSEVNFYHQVVKYKPQITLMSGSFWEAFFRNLEDEMKKGKAPKLDFLDMPIIGGEGVTTDDLRWMNGLMKQAGSRVPMFNGYGLSEVFSVASVQKLGVSNNSDKPVIDVGIPYPAFIAGVFNENGRECKYNERGELWLKTPSLMKGYFEKKDLTERSVIDGWLHTGDIFEIDENGFLYCYGRKSDSIELSDGRIVYLFDIVNELRKDEDVKYAMVNPIRIENTTCSLAIHLVLEENLSGIETVIRLDDFLKQYLPQEVNVAGYKLHKTTFRSSPTTAKKDRNSYIKELNGYIKPVSGRMASINFVESTEDDCFRAVESYME